MSDFYGKKGRRLRRIAELQKIQHPGELSVELQEYANRNKPGGYGGYDEVKSFKLHKWQNANATYQQAQKEIQRIKLNLLPKRNKIFGKPSYIEHSYSTEQYLSDNAEVNGE